jgi:hypothetical protein
MQAGAIEDADVVQAQEAPFENIAPGAVLAIDPPGEIEQQFLKAALEPFLVPFARLGHFQRISKGRGPGVYRRIDVAEVPLIGGDLAVGMHVALAQHQLELLFAEIGIDER